MIDPRPLDDGDLRYTILRSALAGSWELWRLARMEWRRRLEASLRDPERVAALIGAHDGFEFPELVASAEAAKPSPAELVGPRNTEGALMPF